MSVVDDYLEKLTDSQRESLERVRQIVLKIVPDAQEVITYGMPGFKYKKKYLVAFAEFKDHLSIFPGSEVVATLSPKLGDFKHSKGTIQFTIDKPLPESIIIEAVKLRSAAISKK